MAKNNLKEGGEKESKDFYKNQVKSKKVYKK